MMRVVKIGNCPLFFVPYFSPYFSKENPYKSPPPYEKLVGNLSGAYSRRINIQHRLVYQVLDDEKIVKVLRMWLHYE